MNAKAIEPEERISVFSVWSVEDVMDAAQGHGAKIDEATAEQWLLSHEKAFLDRMAEEGNDILRSMTYGEDWERYRPRAHGKRNDTRCICKNVFYLTLAATDLMKQNFICVESNDELFCQIFLLAQNYERRWKDEMPVDYLDDITDYAYDELVKRYGLKGAPHENEEDC